MASHHQESKTTTNTSTDEQRAHDRSSTSDTFQYQIQKVIGQYSGPLTGEAILSNVSQGGLQFRSDRKMGRGSILKVSSGNDASVKFQSNRIRIIRSDRRPGEYLVAGEFI